MVYVTFIDCCQDVFLLPPGSLGSGNNQIIIYNQSNKHTCLTYPDAAINLFGPAEDISGISAASNL
jgi:hypothetical protein